MNLGRESANISGEKRVPFSSAGSPQRGSSPSGDVKPDAETVEQGRDKFRSPDKEEA